MVHNYKRVVKGSGCKTIKELGTNSMTIKGLDEALILGVRLRFRVRCIY